MINQQLLTELKEIIRTDLGRDFSDAEINQTANNLLAFFEFIINENDP
jgi:hypothetical protein